MPNRSSRATNGDPPSGSMPPADIGVLRERVYNTERNILSTQNEIHEIRSTMATQDDVRSLQSMMSSINSKLDTKLDQVGRPQWQALSVLLTVLVVLGGLVYWPIREKQSDLVVRTDKTDTRIEKVLDRMDERVVSRTEHQERWRQFELADTRRKAEIDEIRNTLVPRTEIAATVLSVQRQIDEIRRDVGGVVTTRDILQSQTRQIEAMQKDLRDLMTQRNNGTRAP